MVLYPRCLDINQEENTMQFKHTVSKFLGELNKYGVIDEYKGESLQRREERANGLQGRTIGLPTYEVEFRITQTDTYHNVFIPPYYEENFVHDLLYCLLYDNVYIGTGEDITGTYSTHGSCIMDNAEKLFNTDTIIEVLDDVVNDKTSQVGQECNMHSDIIRDYYRLKYKK